MLKLKITWPLLIALLFALLVWMIRDQQPPADRQTPKRYVPRSARRTPKPAKIIHNQPVDADGDDDRAAAFDAETARLNQEAMAAATDTFVAHSPRPFKMRQGAWHHDG